MGRRRRYKKYLRKGETRPVKAGVCFSPRRINSAPTPHGKKSIHRNIYKINHLKIYPKKQSFCNKKKLTSLKYIQKNQSLYIHKKN